MTVLQQTPKTAAVVGNGSNKLFNYGFRADFLTDLKIIVTEISSGDVVEHTSNFSATGLGTLGGGTVTFPLSGSAIASTHSVMVERIVPYSQDTSMNQQGAFNPTMIENIFDRFVMQVQQIKMLITGGGGGGGGGPVSSGRIFALRGFGGVANAQTASTGFSLTSLEQYDMFRGIPILDNAGALTLAIDAVAALPVKSPTGAALVAGEWSTTHYYDLIAVNTPVTELRITAGY